MHVDHLHASELRQCAAGGETGGEAVQATRERDVQTIGEKRYENVGFDPLLALMEDRSNGEISLQVFERLLDIP